ncbi:hypothetical protein [Desulfobacula sp.]|uniref:hypothetical protein n=1 Tax=Desulfobacula sp. TaxID=2593537 RepID=UPI0025BE6156|nr:hypothetical protein [Desulfobacula sp.]
MRQITLRQVPENIDILIRVMSKKQNKSINKTIIALLEKALGLRDNSNKKRDLSKLAGTWDKSQSEEFIKNTAMFDKIDREIWE